jgi:hypothetical protein
MGAYESDEKDMMAYGSGTWVRTHDAWVLGARYDTYAANWTYGTSMPVLDIRT